MTKAQIREAELAREAATHLLAAIEELNVAKPLVGQAAWRSVLMWAAVLTPIEQKMRPRA